MRNSEILPDATIRDVVPTLSKPEEYVRVVLSNMMACKRLHGGALVRIGITGTGKMPFHKVTYVQDDLELLFNAFDGANRFDNVRVHQNTWSTGVMSLDEVQTLLGELRGWKGKRPT